MTDIAATITTPFGPVRIHAVGRDQLHVSSVQNEPGGRPLLITRVPYHLSLHLTRTQGTWTEAPNTSLYLRRPDVSYNASFPGPAAIDAMRERLIPAVIGWANAHPRDLEIAEGIRLTRLLETKDEEIAKAEGALATLWAERAALSSQLQGIHEALDPHLAASAPAA